MSYVPKRRTPAAAARDTEIKRLILSGVTCKDVAARFGVSNLTITIAVRMIRAADPSFPHMRGAWVQNRLVDWEAAKSVWFDLSLTGEEAAARIGSNDSTIYHHLGPRGANVQNAHAFVRPYQRAPRAETVGINWTSAETIWRDISVTPKEAAAKIGCSSRTLYCRLGPRVPPGENANRLRRRKMSGCKPSPPPKPTPIAPAPLSAPPPPVSTPPQPSMPAQQEREPKDDHAEWVHRARQAERRRQAHLDAGGSPIKLSWKQATQAAAMMGLPSFDGVATLSKMNAIRARRGEAPLELF